VPASRAAPDGTLCISGSGQRTRRGSVSDCPGLLEHLARSLGTRPGTRRVELTWWVKYYANGRAVRESTGTAKEREARRFLKAREGLVPTG